MEYEALTRDDLANVRAFNSAWLKLQPDRGIEKGVPRLADKRLERLAGTPFMLFSFREQDERLWRSLLGEGRQEDLLAADSALSTELHALQSMGLAFLWELSRRNPYVARIVSGAPLRWCEQIAATTLLKVLDRTAYCLVIEPRFDPVSSIHQRLLRRGGSPVRDRRVYAQISALQVLLTGTEQIRDRQLPAAACRMVRITRQVADEV